jgi:uncharacterized protein (TIGR00730 family)
MKRICVFCGSATGNNGAFAAAAQRLGELIARERCTLIYGGGNIGLMGLLSKTVMSRGGNVIGVIPKALMQRELADHAITDLRVVGSMHERKALMADLADGFIALPGGFGTLDEFAEIVTWAQLGIHCKPCGLLNIENYYRHLISFFDEAVATGFIRKQDREHLIIEDSAETIVEKILSYHPPRDLAKWVSP